MDKFVVPKWKDIMDEFRQTGKIDHSTFPPWFFVHINEHGIGMLYETEYSHLVVSGHENPGGYMFF